MAEHDDIASYEVSEDGVTWRPFDRVRDQHGPLHKRIVFAALAGEAHDNDSLEAFGPGLAPA